MNINNQDTTPYDRMDDALLRQLLGTDRTPETSRTERDDTQGYPMPQPERGELNCRGERIWQGGETVPAMAQPDLTTNKSSHAFGVSGGHLATLYIPVQEFDDLYDEESALKQGTLFRALDLPFVGGKRGR